MNVASLELCRELYELSGWRDVDRHYWNGKVQDDVSEDTLKWGYEHYRDNCCPAYDLGYLVSKLPEIRLETWHDGHVVIKHFTANGVLEKLERLGRVIKAEASTPEDAAAKLAIQLFKQSILKKEDSKAGEA